MASIGIDLVEIDRIKKSMERESFFKHILSREEYEQLKKKDLSAQSMAVNFCAKEAFLKCIGKGLGFCKLNEIQLLREDSGRPYIKLLGKALDFANENGLVFSVSATHTKDYASVVVLSERKQRYEDN